MALATRSPGETDVAALSMWEAEARDADKDFQVIPHHAAQLGFVA